MLAEPFELPEAERIALDWDNAEQAERRALAAPMRDKPEFWATARHAWQTAETATASQRATANRLARDSLAEAHRCTAARSLARFVKGPDATDAEMQTAYQILLDWTGAGS